MEDAIFHIGMAQSVFSALALFSRRKKILSDTIMALWMLAIGFELFHMLIDLNKNPIFNFSSNFSFISITFGPFLYLYVVKRLNEDQKFYYRELWHFGPYLVLSFIHLLFFTSKPMESMELDFSNAFFILSFTKIITLFVSLIIYSLLVIRILVKHLKNIENTYSFSSNKITLNWLKYISIVFILTYFSLIIFFLLDMGRSFSLSSHYIPAYGLTIISFSLSYYGLMQPYFSFKYDLRNSINSNSSRLDQSKVMAYKKKLFDFLMKEKPFLEPELSIQQLAEAVKIPRHSLTQIINEEFNKNFFTFINEYRVQEAQNRLADKQYMNDTVLSIGLSSGFNSKSSFNALFKQYTELTPTEYRKKKLN